MRLFTIILVVKFMQCIQSQHFRHQDIVETGVIMNLYLHSEIALWDSHVNIESMTHEERSKSILNEHYNFVSSYLEGFLNNTDFKNLINSYGWHSLQTDLVNVHRLFSFFTKHLKRGSYNKEESIDLTEHILNDSTWSLTEVIKNLEKVVMKEKLYSKDISVSKKLIGISRKKSDLSKFLSELLNDFMHHSTIQTSSGISSLSSYCNY